MNNCSNCNVLVKRGKCNRVDCPSLCGCHLKEVSYPDWQEIPEEKSLCDSCATGCTYPALREREPDENKAIKWCDAHTQRACNNCNNLDKDNTAHDYCWCIATRQYVPPAYKTIAENVNCQWKAIKLVCSECGGTGEVKYKLDKEIACWNCCHSDTKFADKNPGLQLCRLSNKQVHARYAPDKCKQFHRRNITHCPTCSAPEKERWEDRRVHKANYAIGGHEWECIDCGKHFTYKNDAKKCCFVPEKEERLMVPGEE